MLYDKKGKRKYLNFEERNRFIQTARTLPLDEQTFCLFLAFTGCRISEALQSTTDRLDLEERGFVLRSLKKRRTDIYRMIPLPDWLLEMLQKQSRIISTMDDKRLWPWSRTKGWLVIKKTINLAQISGYHASPKGLRHGFGVNAVLAGAPLNMVQKWLGHSRIETTAIYTNAIGNEERKIAEKIWKFDN